MESLADSVSQMTTATYQLPAACKYHPKSADELLKVCTHPGSLSSRLVNDEHAAETTISNAAATTDIALLSEVIEQVGIAKSDFTTVEDVAKNEQALVDKAETKLDEELAIVAQEKKDERAAIEKAKADAKLKYEAEVKQIEADGQSNLERICSKEGVIEEARDTLLKSSSDAQTHLKALVKIGRQGAATLMMATKASNADEPKLKANRDRLIGMQRAWKQAQDSGDDGILKEEILGKDLDKDRMQV